MNELLGVLLFFSVLACVVFLVAIYFRRQCPSCARDFAMKATGETSSGEGLVAPDEEKYSCRYCGYSEWRKVEPDG